MRHQEQTYDYDYEEGTDWRFMISLIASGWWIIPDFLIQFIKEKIEKKDKRLQNPAH